MEEDVNWEERRERYRGYRGPRHRMKHHDCGPSGGGAFAGILLVAIGAVFLLGNMGYLDVRYVFRNFWPLLLIFLGIKMLVVHQRESSRGSMQGIGVFWLLLGAFFLFSNLNFGFVPPFQTAFRMLWPFVPLAIGAFILWKVFIDNPERHREEGHDAGDSESEPASDSSSDTSSSRVFATASFAHIKRRCNSQNFRGGRLSTFMGACEADLRGASPAGGEAVLDVSAFMGGIEVKVPRDWTVVNEVSAFMGGVEDKTDPPAEEAKRLVLRGSVFMGGVEVKN